MADLDVIAVVDTSLGIEEIVGFELDVVLVNVDHVEHGQSALMRTPRTRLPGARVVALGIYPTPKAAAHRAGAHAVRLTDAGDAALQAAILDDGDDSDKVETLETFS